MKAPKCLRVKSQRCFVLQVPCNVPSWTYGMGLYLKNLVHLCPGFCCLSDCLHVYRYKYLIVSPTGIIQLAIIEGCSWGHSCVGYLHCDAVCVHVKDSFQQEVTPGNATCVCRASSRALCACARERERRGTGGADFRDNIFIGYNIAFHFQVSHCGSNREHS
jgi:hypothetical protein